MTDDKRKNEMTDSLTKREAYAAMFTFLEEIYNATKSDDLGALLGSMSMLQDGTTADTAIWSEWEEAIAIVMDGKDDIELDLR